MGGTGQEEESFKDVMKNLASGWFAISTHKNRAQVRPITPLQLQAMYVRGTSTGRAKGSSCLR